MTDLAAPQDSPEEDGQTSSREDNSSGTAENPAVAKARAHADARIREAEIARSAAFSKDLWIGLPIVGAFSVAAMVILMWWMKSNQNSAVEAPVDGVWGLVCLGVAVGIIVVGGVRKSGRTAVLEEINRAEEFNIQIAELNYTPEVDAPLAANRALLQEYHRLSTNQARSAFRLAQWVMGTAALLVFVGATAVIAARTTATAVTLAALTAFISALSGYISATLLATYRVSEGVKSRSW